MIKKDYCRCGPHPPQVTTPRARPPLAKGQVTLAPRNSGVGHPGPWPPLHCRDPTALHRRLPPVPHCTLRLSHPRREGMSGDRRLWANSTCRSRVMGTIGTDCPWVARATTPRPPPQPHDWVRLGFEISRFTHFWVGLSCAEFPRGVEFRGPLALFCFSTSLKKKNLAIWPQGAYSLALLT